jgi:hypothetical protein
MSEGIAKLAFVDPQCIHIEHVCIAFGVSRKEAKKICRKAVARGLFYRQFQVLSPDGSIAAFASSRKDLPTSVMCLYDREGNRKPQLINTKKLRKREVFALLKSPTAFETGSFPEPTVL